MILLADERVAAVPVVDCGERLVDLDDVPELKLDSSQSSQAGFAGRYVREGLFRRLLAAQDALVGDGLRLLIIEGYRPPDRQRTIFDGYRDELRRLHPGWPDRRLFSETTKFVSPVEVAPHVTGGAVDLTLCAVDGVPLDMGTCVDATPEASRNACFTAARNISRQARRHRRLLVDALTGAGLVNYPTEWWHWSYGDRYWALVTGAYRARYGPLVLSRPVSR